MDPTPSGFAAFVAARSPALLRTAYLLTADAHRAEDLLQDALVRVAGRWESVAGKGEPEPYVRRVLYTLAVDGWRRRRLVEVPTAAPRDVPVDADLQEAASRRLVLGAALARLAPRQRAVLVLRFYEDLTEVQTAEALGISPSTVKTTAREALARLRVLAPELADAFGPAAVADDARGSDATTAPVEVPR